MELSSVVIVHVSVFYISTRQSARVAESTMNTAVCVHRCVVYVLCFGWSGCAHYVYAVVLYSDPIPNADGRRKDVHTTFQGAIGCRDCSRIGLLLYLYQTYVIPVGFSCLEAHMCRLWLINFDVSVRTTNITSLLALC